MQRWSSSTVFVAAAFGLSVVLLFAKAGSMRERATEGRAIVTHHIYSPAAADPALRDQDRAERLTKRPVSTTSRAVVVREPAATSRPAASASAPSSPVDERPLRRTPTDPTKPFYVVAGTFETRANAEKGLAQLQAKGLHQSFLGVFNEGKYTSVIARNFASEDKARLLLAELEDKHNIKGYIYHKTEE